MSDYEYTPQASAERLLGFIGDFSDDYEELVNEIPTIENAIKTLRESGGDLEILSFALDRMFMSSEFERGYEWLQTLKNKEV